VAVLGAGGVGSYVAGRLSVVTDITVIDGWSIHIRAIRDAGLRVEDARGTTVLRPQAIHLHEVGDFVRVPIDVALVCVKSYDTSWAVELLKPYLGDTGFFLTLQNGVNEEEIARRAGWGKVLGAVVSGISVNTDGPGRVVRSVASTTAEKPVFRVGEMSGLASPRARSMADLLARVDTSTVTTTLWSDRWEKLTSNCIFNGACALLGVGTGTLMLDSALHPFLAAVGAEALDAGAALGFQVESALGLTAAELRKVAGRDEAAGRVFETKMMASSSALTDTSMPSTAQDIAKGRRTEIDFLNGYVAARAMEVGLACPANRYVTSRIHDIEQGRSVAGDPRYRAEMAEWTSSP
jgi:2-dehydropantoate 2-reductase